MFCVEALPRRTNMLQEILLGRGEELNIRRHGGQGIKIRTLPRSRSQKRTPSATHMFVDCLKVEVPKKKGKEDDCQVLAL